MAFIYTTASLFQVCVLFASFIALMFFIGRAIIRSIFMPKEPPPPKEDLRHLKRAGQ